jgi:flagellar hook-associated protein 2
MTSVDYEGRSYSLASFGINTSVYTERGILHIDGDSEDSATSGNKDKLMKALEENPEAVMNTLSTLTGSLYSEMTDKMKATTLSSALTFYNDKEITKNIKTYKTDLSKLEDRLKVMEDRYYDQFGAMETAMAKLNSQTNSLASLMGTNS